MNLSNRLLSNLLLRIACCGEHGNLRDDHGLFEKAISAYDIALGIDPEDADALFDKGKP